MSLFRERRNHWTSRREKVIVAVGESCAKCYISHQYPEWYTLAWKNIHTRKNRNPRTETAVAGYFNVTTDSQPNKELKNKTLVSKQQINNNTKIILMSRKHAIRLTLALKVKQIFLLMSGLGPLDIYFLCWLCRSEIGFLKIILLE